MSSLSGDCWVSVDGAGLPGAHGLVGVWPRGGLLVPDLPGFIYLLLSPLWCQIVPNLFMPTLFCLLDCRDFYLSQKLCKLKDGSL